MRQAMFFGAGILRSANGHLSLVVSRWTANEDRLTTSDALQW